MEDSSFYFLNGVSLVLVQLFVRVLNWPLVILLYTARYHNWDWLSAFNSLYTVCVVSTGVWQVLEIYWFWLILQLAASGFKKKKKTQ